METLLVENYKQTFPFTELFSVLSTYTRIRRVLFDFYFVQILRVNTTTSSLGLPYLMSVDIE